MCDNCCLSLIVRQIYCQNGNRRTNTSSFSFLTTGAVINLDFGYSILISNVSGCTLTFILRDGVNTFPDQTITLSGNSFKMINLPAQNGTYRLYLILDCRSCCSNS